MEHTLGRRGRQLVERPPFAAYILAHFERLAARDGDYVALCIAENRSMWEELATRLACVKEVPLRALGYDAMIGSIAFREALAAYMSRAFLGRTVEAKHLAVLAGAGSVLELLFYTICDPGDGVLVPTPSYAGFWADLETRDGLTIVPVERRSADGFRLDLDALDRAVARAGRPVKALLFTSPDNPLGRVYEAHEIEAVLAWGEQAGIHVVLDEIYALSVFGSRPFVSGASLRPSLGERTHIVWAFSKDFGASGLRCGVLVSENEAVLRAVDGLAYWAACSGHTQHLLAEIVSDTSWVDGYVAENRRRLRASYERVTEALTEHGIPFVPADGGIFLLVDSRGFLHDQTREAEHRLWRRILDDANVNLTPGSACRIAEHGFFRLCYAAEPIERVVAAIERVGRVLRQG